MGSFEQQPLRKESVTDQESVVLSSPQVQKALIELWAEQSEEKFADHNALAMAWISQGFAEKFGFYRDTHQDDVIDVHNEDSLRKILSEIGYSKWTH